MLLRLPLLYLRDEREKLNVNLVFFSFCALADQFQDGDCVGDCKRKKHNNSENLRMFMVSLCALG